MQAGHHPGRMKTSTDGSMLPQSQHRAEAGAGARPVLPGPGRGMQGGRTSRLPWEGTLERLAEPG